MIALDIVLAVLVQSSVSAPAQSETPAPRPDVVVVGPSTRMVCRIVTMSNSRIPARRVCRSQLVYEQQLDRVQAEAARAMEATDRLTDYELVRSPYMRGGAGPIDTSRPRPPPR